MTELMGGLEESGGGGSLKLVADVVCIHKYT